MLYEKDAFDQLGCWQCNANRIMYIKQLARLPVVEIAVQIPHKKTTLIMLQLKYTCQTQLHFQGKISFL